jgi:hypothetical protein
MRCIRLVILLASTLFATLLVAAPALAVVTPVTFTGPTNFAVGDGPNSVAVGDFNGDGDPDLAVANEFAGSVSVLLGGAGGSFSAATNIATGGFPFAVAVGDFNGDRDPDLAVADAFDGIISVLLGGAGGSFGGPTNFPAGSFPAAVAVGEFNGDGDPDLAVADQLTGAILVLRGSTGGSFTAPTTVGTATGPFSIAVGEFNGDSDPDLAVADPSDGGVRVLLGSTGATFTAPATVASGGDPVSVGVGDFNGDGDPDLAVADQSPGEIMVLLGSTGGTFAAPTILTTDSGVSAIAVADFNRDGDPDLAVSNNDFSLSRVSVLLGSTGGTFTAPSHFAVGSTQTSVVAADFNGDGKPDLAATKFNTDNVAVLLNNTVPPNTKPSVTVKGVSDKATYEAGVVPTAICQVTDAEDGPSSFSAALSGTLFHELGTQTAICQYTDKGGLAADPVTLTYTIVDTGDPTIDHTLDPASPNDNDWYKTSVAIDFSCDDSGSGVKSCEGDITLGEGKDQSVTGTATDWAGNTASDAVSGINVDKTAPTVGFTGGPTGNYYFGNDPAEPKCNASDGLSGIDSCDITGGGSSVGQHTYTATAKDKAGNTAAATVDYEVLPWNLKGFYQPVDMNGVWNTVKGGSTVPLKFEIFAGSTELTNTSSVKSFTQKTVACPGTSAATDEIEIVTTGGTSLRYDSTADQFIQNWQTPKKSGTCYVTTMTSQDGSTVSANFMLK